MDSMSCLLLFLNRTLRITGHSKRLTDKGLTRIAWDLLPFALPAHFTITHFLFSLNFPSFYTYFLYCFDLFRCAFLMSGAPRPPDQRIRRPAAQRARVYRHAAVRYAPGAGGESEISCCVKYSVFAFNVIFFLVGVTLLLIGVWAQTEKTSLYGQLNKASKLYLDPTWLFIIVGLVTFTIGFSGCVGSLRENTSFLTSYSTLLGLLLVAELAAGVFAYACKDQLDQYIRRLLNDVIEGYRDDPDLQILIDSMQESWHCCGINSADDWDKNNYFSTGSREFQSPEAGGVPFSCCVNSSMISLKNYFCGHGVRLRDQNAPTSIYTEGCLPKFQLWLNNNVLLVGIGMVIAGVVQIMGICFAQNLKSDIFAQRSKWYMDH